MKRRNRGGNRGGNGGEFSRSKFSLGTIWVQSKMQKSPKDNKRQSATTYMPRYQKRLKPSCIKVPGVLFWWSISETPDSPKSACSGCRRPRLVPAAYLGLYPEGTPPFWRCQGMWSTASTALIETPCRKSFESLRYNVSTLARK
jgi:hypothetical protein